MVGEAQIRFRNTSGVVLDDVRLWLHGNRFAVAPPLDEVTFHWVFPRRVDLGATRLLRLAVGGLPARGEARPGPAGTAVLWRAALPAPLRPGGTITVAAHFETRLPVRYGAFGCIGDGCLALGGWHPLLCALGSDGWQESAPPPAARFDVSLEVPAAWHAFVGTEYFPPPSTSRPGLDRPRPGSGGGDGAAGLAPGAPAGSRPLAEPSPAPVTRVVHARVEDAIEAPVGVRRRLFESTMLHRGVRVRLLHPRLRPPSSEHLPLPYALRDYPGLVLRDLREALDFTAEIGLAGALPNEVTIVEGPLRTEIAEAHGPVVLLSERFSRVFPAERLRKFHTFQMLRAFWGSLLERRLARGQPARDLALAADAVAAYLVDVFTIWRHRRAEFVRDFIRYLSFIPTVDWLLYAPQAPFAGAYFGSVDEPDLLRADLRRMANAHPRGRLLYEKFRDLTGLAGMAEAARSMIGGYPLREAFARAAGRDLSAFFRQWTGPPPAVNYRFAVLRSEREGAGYRHEVVVEKQGSAPPEEPVEVFVRDRAGRQWTLRWNGESRSRRFVLHSMAPIVLAHIDPRQRTIQTLADSPEDARGDDRIPGKTRFIYANIAALLNLTSLQAQASVDFVLSHAYRLRHSGRLQAFHTPSAIAGVSGAYYYHFGRRAGPGNLAASVGGGLSFARLNEDFARAAGEGDHPGTRLGAFFGVGHDDRIWMIDPWRVRGLSAAVGYEATVLDSGVVLHQGTASVRGLFLHPFAPGHVLAASASAAATFGDLRIRAQLLSGGGPTGLRGYLAEEILGRLRLVGRLEYRHTFVRNLDWNLGHLAWLNGIAGTLFANLAAVSHCDGYGLAADGVFADAGYGLRFFYELAGVAQGSVSLDVAVPLNRHDRICLQRGSQGTTPRPPVSVFLSFYPTF